MKRIKKITALLPFILLFAVLFCIVAPVGYSVPVYDIYGLLAMMLLFLPLSYPLAVYFAPFLLAAVEVLTDDDDRHT